MKSLTPVLLLLRVGTSPLNLTIFCPDDQQEFYEGFMTLANHLVNRREERQT